MTNTTRADAPSHNAFLAVAALLFTACAAATVAWCASMSAIGGMTMPGGWTMSMAWMRMPEQSWLEVAASFLGMWTVMMVAMMLPSVVAMLGRYRLAAGNMGATRLASLTLRVAIAYFLVWTAIGVVVFAAGAALAQVEMRVAALSRAAPIAAGIVVMVAGAVQFTAWKAHQLSCWSAEVRTSTPGRHGLELGLRCARSCANLTAILLVIGVMDLRAMALVTVAITAERMAFDPRVARAIGVMAVAAGMLLVLIRAL